MPAFRKSSPVTTWRKLRSFGAIAVLTSLVTIAIHHLPGTALAMSKLDDLLYDAMYHLRPIESQREGQVVIVTADDSSLNDLAHGMIGKTPYGWPWPRNFWGIVVGYLNKCGAKAIAFDVIFSEPSVYNNQNGDDDVFAKAINGSKAPVIIGTLIGPDGVPNKPAPPFKNPRLGGVNVGDDVVYRTYRPMIDGAPSLAARTMQAIGQTPPSDPFRLHYYGPNHDKDGHTTFKFLTASHVLGSGVSSKFDYGIRPEMIRDKIVLIGTTTAGTYDIKSSPLSKEFPGVEVQATAIANMLAGQRVVPASSAQAISALLLVTLLAALGTGLPRRVIWKIAAAVIVTITLLLISTELFRGQVIHWLPLASPIVGLLLATLGAFAWNYLIEGRQRRLVVKALSQYVSPEVAAQIDRDPGALKLSGERRTMTVMFTDIQGFTDLSERLDEHKLTDLLNYYLDEMSSIVLSTNGTLDKYIGDAIMSFWSAPIEQSDHALRACRAAVAMEKREREIQDTLNAMGASGLLTRIGINTGPMVFGNMGSKQKFNYSVLGDAVNLGSRLEGANKFYGSRILVALPTAELVRGQIVMRKLDVLRVKGKLKPMPVYEVLAEAPGDEELEFRVRLYEDAFEYYQQRRWSDALAQVKLLLSRAPFDAPAIALRDRIENMISNPPSADWDGVYVAKGK